MVRIINYKEKTSDEGKTFFLLQLEGPIEILKSKATGKSYATAQRAYLSTTFDEVTCKALLGSELDGSIQKVECDPYEYTIESTGEIKSLNHRYEYVKEVSESIVKIPKRVVRHEEVEDEGEEIQEKEIQELLHDSMGELV